MNSDEKYQGIIIHPYIKRRGKQFILINNATVDSTNVFMCVLDIAEKMCTCSDEYFEKLLPIFKESYFMMGDADKEIRFIESQRKAR